MIETPISAIHAEVHDDEGRLRYTLLHPHYREGDKWVKSVPELKPADEGDACDYKCSTGTTKVGISATGWHIGIKTRTEDKQLLAKPVALTRWSGEPDIRAITNGVFETVRPTALNKADTKASMSEAFSLCDIEPQIDNGGRLMVQHTLHKEMVDRSEYYGVIWEVNTPDFTKEIHGSGTEIFTYSVDDRYFFCEYVPRSVFGSKDDGSWGDYSHTYTTISGTISTNTTYSGTVYVSSVVTLGSNTKLTFQAGTVIKSDITTAQMFELNETADNPSEISFEGTEANPIIITSKNDDSVGETITGSSGTPSAGDYFGIVYMWGSGENFLSGSWVQVHYMGGTGTGVLPAGAFISTTSSSTYHTYNLDHIYFYNGYLDETGGYHTGVIGGWRYIVNLDDFDVTDIYFDSTFELRDSIYTYACRVPYASGTLSVDRWSINTSTSYQGRGLYFYLLDGDSVTISGIQVNARLSRQIYAIVFSGSATLNVNECTFVESSSGGWGLHIENGITCNVRNSIFKGLARACSAGSAGTIINANYCGFYGNTADSGGSGAVNFTGKISEDPQFTTVPSGATISSDCVIPDGFFVSNATDYNLQGSDTYDNLSIDESIFSSTGYQYGGSQKVTPGVMYKLSQFPYTTVSGGTISGYDFLSGTYYVTGDLQMDDSENPANIAPGVVIKIAEGVNFLQFYNGVHSDANAVDCYATAANPAYITSENDNTVGETIFGSSGSPTQGDWGFCIHVPNNDNNDVYISNLIVRYAESDKGIITNNVSTDSSSDNRIVINGLRLESCGTPASLSYHVGLVGRYRYANTRSSRCSLNRVYIDSSCDIKDSTYGHAIMIGNESTHNLSNSYIGSDAEGFFFYNQYGASSITVQNCVFEGCYRGVVAYSNAGDYTITVRNCVFDGCTAQGVYAYGTLVGNVISVYDSIFESCATALASSTNPSAPSYNCGFYNNTSNGGETKTSPIYSDPQFTVAPTHSAFASDNIIPNGYVVGNRSDYRYSGSDTYNNLSIDESKYSATGYEDNGTDNVTPGIMYEWSAFAKIYSTVTIIMMD